MDKKEILKGLELIMREIMDNAEIKISNDTNANDIEEWDSLTHVQLLVAIEKSYGIKFTSREMLSFEKIEDIVECINKKK